jgi:2-iminobutanoate/2-iminopropanoate deaminase
MPVNRRKFLQTTGASAIALTTAGQAKAQTAKAKAAPKKKRKVLTDKAPKPGPYSQAIIANNTVYVAGQVPTNPKSGKIDAVSFEEQATQVFENIKAIVEAAGSSLENVVSVRVFLADLNNFQNMNTIYRQYFTGDLPARTTIGAQLLPNIQIEVDCIAVV